MASSYSGSNGAVVTNTASGATVKWQSKLTVGITETATSITVTYTGAFAVTNGTAPMFKANRVTASLVVGGVTVKSYSGPSSQTNWKNTVNLVSYSATYQKTTAIQPKAVSFKITVSSYSSWKGTSTASGTLSIDPLAAFAITYSNNGGSGSIDNQTKYYGIDVNLSDGSDFTRQNYSLIEWNTANDGTGTQYALGGVYSENALANLYAIWHLDYIKAEVSNFKVFRIKDLGDTDPSDTGTYLHVEFEYTPGYMPGEPNDTIIQSQCLITIDDIPETPFALTSDYSHDFDNSGQGYSTETTHTVTINVYTEGDYDPFPGITKTESVDTATYPIDLVADENDPTKVYMGIMSPAISGQPLTLGERAIEPDMGAQELSDFIDSLNPSSSTIVDYVEEQGSIEASPTGAVNFYRKWHSGKAEFWWQYERSNGLSTAVWSSPIYYLDATAFSNIWDGVFISAPPYVYVMQHNSQILAMYPWSITASGIAQLRTLTVGAKTNQPYSFSVYAVGAWK